MVSKCEKKISEYFSVGINGIFHVLILFTFLTILFFTIVLSLEKSAFENEMTNEINSSVKNMASKIQPSDKDQISNVVNKSVNEDGQSSLDVAIDKYSTPSDFIVEHNKWVKITAIAIILGVFVFLLTILVVLSYSCDKCIGLSSIVKENIITFIFVGMVEYLFFTHIAFKYVPAPPSTMVTTIIDTFKKTFV